MEALIGISGKDYVIMAADRRLARSIVVMKGVENKFRDLGPTMTMAYSGEPGDASTFAEYVQGNIKLYEMRNEYPLNTQSAAHFTRHLLAESLRSRNPYQTNLLIGGADQTDGGKLYWVDYLGALTEMPFAAHGYASYFVLSLMDRHYRKDMNVEEALQLLKMCLQELKTRFIVALPDFTVKVIKPSGIENLVMAI